MEELTAYRQRMLQHWEATPGILKRALAGITGEAWHRAPGGGEPTPHQVLSHLRSIEQTVIAPSIRRLLEGENDLPFPYPAWEDWLEGYAPQEAPRRILEAYLSLRAAEIGWIRECIPPPWNALGRHPQHGKRTLQWWVEESLAQARAHARSLARLSAGGAG